MFSLLKNSESCSLVSVFIYDNSPEYASPVASDNTIYRRDALNSGVSRAYNEAAKEALRMNKPWMLILDQDTTIDLHFFKKLIEAYNKYPAAGVYVPKLYDQYGMVSPFRWRLGKGIRIYETKIKLPLKNFRFVNSGLLIRCDIFNSVNGYEENIPLDFSDIAFGEKLMKATDHFIVADAALHHSFSASTENSLDQTKVRFGYFCKGALAMGKTFGPFYLYFIRAFLRSVKLSLTFKTFSFIKKFLYHFKYD